MVKLFLSGAENKNRQSLFIRHQVKYLLLSYLHLDDIKTILRFKIKIPGCEIFLDSGAHTLQKGKSINYERFVQSYALFVKRYKKLIDYYVELDIENVVGLEKVERWREYLYRTTKKEPIVVWHKWRGVEYWKYMAQRYKLIGFSGFVSENGKKEVPDKKVKDFVRIANSHNAKVHGFGYVRLKPEQLFGFYSIDSTSWLAGARYGVFYYFNPKTKRLDSYNTKDFVTKFKGKFNLFSHSIIDEWNLLQWKKYQEVLDNEKYFDKSE